MFSAILLPINIGLDVLVEEEPIAQAIISQSTAAIGGYLAYKVALVVLAPYMPLTLAVVGSVGVAFGVGYGLNWAIDKGVAWWYGTGDGSSTDCPCECHDPEMVDQPNHVADPPQSPIILDLDGDGVETVSVEDGVYFDHDGNGFAEKTGWAGSDDALLVWDANGNGQIDGGSELFGNNSILSNGEEAANGFEALREFDSNNDGIVNADDERWSELQLWQDKNGNGVVDDGEILTLEEAGVAGLNVDYTEQSYTDENGNEHRQSGSFIREDGTTAQMTDVWFSSDLTDTKFLDEINVSEAIAQLPNLRGYGNIPSLHQTMARDENGLLQTLVEQFLNKSNPLEAKEMVWDIIYAWTGVTDIAPDSRGQYIADARKLEAMERLQGQKWESLSCWGIYSPNPHSHDGPNLET